MATLKDKINRILGNNVRLLLPSYWWKRLFGMVVDKVDEVEQSTSKLIDSKIEEVKMPIVESVDELSKLNLPKGGVAAVEKVGEPVVVNLEDCYLSADAATDWDKYTVIRGFSEKGAPSNAVGQIHLYSDKSMENGLTIACGEGKYFYYKIVNGRRYDSSLEEVNKYLASGEYRLVFGYYIENVSAYVTLYSAFPQPSLYIKGDSWEKLSKEYAVSSEEELNALSVEKGTIARVVREIEPQAVKVSDCYLTNNTDNYANEWDKFTVIKKIEETDVNAESSNILYICALNESFRKDAIGVGYDNGVRVYTRIVDGVESPVSLDIVNDLLATGNYRLVIWAIAGRFDSYFTFYTEVAKDVSDAYIKGDTWTRLLKEGEGGSNITVDSELSDTSENAVQNKVITAALNNKADKSDIKTINGVSLLGGGDITISGGGVSEDYVNTAIANAITTTLNTEV